MSTSPSCSFAHAWLRRLPVGSAVLFAGLFLSGCSWMSRDGDEAVSHAKSLLTQSKATEAVIELKDALQRQPTHVGARLLLGQILLAQGDASSAAAELERAQDSGAADDDVAPARAAALLGLGESARLVAMAGQVKLSRPTAIAEFQTSVSKAYALLGDKAAAEASVSVALKADPRHPGALVQAGTLEARAGHLDEAEVRASAALQAKPNDADALVLKAEVALRRNSDADALVLLRQAVAADPKSARAHGALVERLLRASNLPEGEQALAAMRKQFPNRPDTLYFEGRMALASGNRQLANDRAQRLIAASPENPLFLELAGDVASAMGELPLAEKHFAKLVQKDSSAAVPRLQLAAIQLKRGDPDLALSTLAPMLSDTPPDTRALALAGRAHFVRGDVRQAETFLTRSLKQDPKSVSTRTALGANRLKAGDLAGMTDLRTAADQDSGIDADLALIAALDMRRDMAGAMKALAHLETKPGGKSIAPLLRGQLLFAAGDIKGARTSFGTAASLDPESFQPVRSLAELDMRSGQPAAAVERVRTFLNTHPKKIEALLMMAGLQDLTGHAEEIPRLLSRAVEAATGDIRPRLALVRWHSVRGETQQALAAAQAAVAIAPESFETLGALGHAHIAAGDFNQGITLLTKAAAAQPMLVEPLLALADAQASSGAHDNALQTMNKARQLAPDSRLVLLRLAQGLVAAKQPVEALALARSLQARSPKLAIGYVIEGDTEAAAKRWPAAASAYRMALQRDPDPGIAQRRHLALVASGDAASAETFANEWRRAYPRELSFAYYLAQRAISAKRPDAAEQQLRQILAEAPDNAQALNELASILGQAHKPGALALAERAVKLQPGQPDYFDTLAGLLSDAGQKTEALTAQKRAVALAPAVHDFRLRLARMYLESGDRDRARAELALLAKLGDHYARQAEVKGLRAQL